jgi:hypothetical protein
MKLARSTTFSPENMFSSAMVFSSFRFQLAISNDGEAFVR